MHPVNALNQRPRCAIMPLVHDIRGENREPTSGYFVGATRFQPLRFFTIPGEDIVLDEVTGSHYLLTQGDLYFEQSEGHWYKGIYTLQIKNKDLNVKLPIPLGIEGELEQVK